MKNQWPKPTPEEVDAFYAKISLGDDGQPTSSWQNNFLKKILLPYPMRLAWAPDVVISKLRCHREVAGSLMRCLDAIFNHFGSREAVSAAGLDLYGGCYAYRASHRTRCLSMHAYGAAIDFVLPPKTEMPLEVIAIFEAEGWAWGGERKSNPEIGHFEAVNRK